VCAVRDFSQSKGMYLPRLFNRQVTRNHLILRWYIHSLTLNIRPPLIKRNEPPDPLHILQRLRIIPRRILDFRLIGRDCVVRRISLVRAVRFGRCRRKVRFCDGVGWELSELVRQRGWRREGGERDGRRCSRLRLRRYLFRRRGRRLRRRLRGAFWGILLWV
jgi:hypothetical protein